MRINLDRLCRLAGVEASSEVLSESSNRSYHDGDNSDEVQFRYGGEAQLAEADEGMELPMEEDMSEEDTAEEGVYEDDHAHDDMDEDDDGMDIMPPAAEAVETVDEADHEAHEAYMNEMIEVDEAMLVQEIRRARKMMAESRQREETSPEQLQEQQLRKIVAEEIDSVMKDLNLTSGWVYGSKKPTNSRQGVVNTAFPGIGFKNSK